MTRSAPLPEPSIQNMIDDPIVKLLMARDGVSEESLRPLLDETSLFLRRQERAALRKAP